MAVLYHYLRFIMNSTSVNEYCSFNRLNKPISFSNNKETNSTIKAYSMEDYARIKLN